MCYQPGAKFLKVLINLKNFVSIHLNFSHPYSETSEMNAVASIWCWSTHA